MKAKTYVLDDLIVCVLHNSFTAIEQMVQKAARAQGINGACALLRVTIQRETKGARVKIEGEAVFEG